MKTIRVPLQDRQEKELTQVLAGFSENPTPQDVEIKRKIKMKIIQKYDRLRDQRFPGWREGGAV